MRIEQLIEVSNELEDTLEKIAKMGFSVQWIRVRVLDEPVIDITVDVDHNVSVNPQHARGH